MIKKITLLLLLVVAFSWQGNAQSIIIGTGTTTDNDDSSGPVDGYFKAMKYQTVYTAAELSASLTAYDEITALGFSISEDYGGGSLLNYTIKMGHTSATNSSTHDDSPVTVVKNAFNYDPTATAAGVFDMITFDTNFVWNGVDNILIEICTDGPNAFTSPYGGVRNTSMTSGSRRYRSDDTTACDHDTSSSNSNRPNIQFNYIDGTPPSCLPPTGLAVGTMTLPSNAAISLNAVTGASGYNYEIQPQGTAQGTAGAIASGSSTNTSFNVTTGLVSGTIYTLYVQTDCGGGDSSTYASLNFTFAPEPANDECSGAISLTVNSDLDCGTVQAGSIFGATVSGVDEESCSGTENDDVWFSFVATTTVHQIKLTNVAGSTTDLYHSVWEGSCGSLTLVPNSCSDNNTSSPGGLTVGNTYYIRVNSYYGNSGATTTFDICVGTFSPAPANDNMAGATPITPSDEGTGCSSSSYTFQAWTAETGLTDSGMDGSCDGTDTGLDVFYSWTADSPYLIWNDGNGYPGIIIRDTSGNEITCESTSASPNTVLSGWSVGDNLIIQIYDYGTSRVDVSFCLEKKSVVDPMVNYNNVNDCANSQFTIDVDITDLGGASAVTITDDQSSPSQNATATGIVTFGPYSTGTSVKITVTNDDDSSFKSTSSTIKDTCPPPAVTPDYSNDFATYPGTSWRESEGDFATPNLHDTTSGWEQGDYLNDASHANGDSAKINIYGESTNEYLITVPFDLTASTYYLNYDIGLTDYDDPGTDAMGPDDYLSLLVSQDYGATWTELKKWTATDNLSNTGGAAPEITLTGYGAVTMFAFYAFSDTSNTDYDVYIDNFSITSSSLGVADTTISGFTYYPNPVNDQLSLRANNNIDNVILRNILGQTVLTVAPSATSTAIDMSQLKQGTYFVSVQVGDAIQTVKVMKN